MKNILLKISYDGTNYSGFQKQPGKITIESVILSKIQKLTNESVKLQYAGRTDAGVHSFANYLNFHTNSSIPPNKFPTALNSILPKDIRILNANEVDQNFNTRKEVIERIYRYIICNDKIVSPFKYKYSLHYSRKIDIKLLNESVKYFIGKKNFNAFRSSDCCSRTSVREIKKFNIRYCEKDLIIEISANGFLKNMVRIIVGTLLEINEGKIKLVDLEKIILFGDRKLAGRTVSPQGLFLVDCIFKNID